MKKSMIWLSVLLISAGIFAEEYRVLPEARQTIYMNGVPHLDISGRTRFTYDPEKSFFPLALYHPTLHMDENARQHPTPFHQIKEAGFNTLHHNRTYENAFFEVAARHDFRIIKGGSSVEEALRWVDRPEILMWEVFDEPDGDGKFDAYPSRFEHFRDYYRKLREADPVRPIFVNTVAWIKEPNRPWFIQWHQVSDISCHDNYPKKADDTPSWSSSQGIPESMKLAVDSVRESKPVLFIVQAFGEMAPPEPGERFHLDYPTPPELRSMVYSALVAGATGIDYFTLDNSVCRNAAQLYGISPAPLESYEGPGKKLTATPEQLNKITALWGESSRINHEILRLAPWLLSPTDPAKYEVAVAGKAYTPNPVRALLKNYQDRPVLLLVNLDRASLKVRLTMPGIAEANDFFTGDACKVNAGILTLPLNEFGVKILELKKKEKNGE